MLTGSIIKGLIGELVDFVLNIIKETFDIPFDSIPWSIPEIHFGTFFELNQIPPDLIDACSSIFAILGEIGEICEGFTIIAFCMGIAFFLREVLWEILDAISY